MNNSKASTRITMKLIGIVGLFLIGLGCDDSHVTWSTESYSPSRDWRATAYSRHHGGPGTVLNQTVVYLQQGTGNHTPSVILSFTHEYPTMYLKLEWITDNHLEVTYGETGKSGDHVDLNFQAVKFLRVEITTKEIPSGTSKATTN